MRKSSSGRKGSLWSSRKLRFTLLVVLLLLVCLAGIYFGVTYRD